MKDLEGATYFWSEHLEEGVKFETKILGGVLNLLPNFREGGNKADPKFWRCVPTLSFIVTLFKGNWHICIFLPNINVNLGGLISTDECHMFWDHCIYILDLYVCI